MDNKLIEKYLTDGVTRRKAGGPELRYKGFEHPIKKYVKDIQFKLADMLKSTEREDFKDADNSLKSIKKMFSGLEKQYKKTKAMVKDMDEYEKSL